MATNMPLPSTPSLQIRLNNSLVSRKRLQTWAAPYLHKGSPRAACARCCFSTTNYCFKYDVYQFNNLRLCSVREAKHPCLHAALTAAAKILTSTLHRNIK